MDRVEKETLKVEFCWGYAGVIIGIRWYLSDILTLGSQTGKPSLLSSGAFNNTGFGHSLIIHFKEY